MVRAASVWMVAGVLCSFGCSSDEGDGGGGTGAAGTAAGTGAASGTGGMMAGTGAGGTMAGTGGMAPVGGTTATGGTTAVAGTSATGGTGAVTGGMGAGTGATDGDKGMGDGSDVITIGDSYMLFIITGIQVSLDAISGQTYRHYAFPGTSVLNEQIPMQYTTAKAAGPIRTVVATGGGNDIILNASLQVECGQFTQTCRDNIDMIAGRVTELFTEMGNDGVEDIFYVGYLYALLQTAPDYMKMSQDYADGLSMTDCLSDGTGPGGARCHFIHSAGLIPEPHPVSIDNIHPTPEGYDMIGQLVWDRMVEVGARR